MARAALVATLVATGANDVAEHRDQPPPTDRAWSPVENCRRRHPDRPAILGVIYSGPDIVDRETGWTRTEIERSLDDAELPHGTFDRLRGRPEANQTLVQIPGTVGSLLGPARRLAAQPGPALREPPRVEIRCAGLRSLVDSLTIALPARENVHTVIRTVGGGSEQQDGEATDGGDTRFYTLKTTQAGFVIERAIAYLRDRRVISAEPQLACGGFPEDPWPRGCDLSVTDQPVEHDPGNKERDRKAFCRKHVGDAARKQGPLPGGARLTGRDISMCDVYHEVSGPNAICGWYLFIYLLQHEYADVVAHYERLEVGGGVLRDRDHPKDGWWFGVSTWRELLTGKNVGTTPAWEEVAMYIKERPDGVSTTLEVLVTHCVLTTLPS